MCHHYCDVSVCSNVDRSYIILNIATGYLYGFWDGLCITIIGAAISSMVSFVACRKLAKNYVTSLLSSYDNLKQIIRVLDGALTCIVCGVNS